MGNIPVADDQPSNRRVINAVVETADYQVVEAAGGAEALAVARRKQPELVITDILMPTMDGFEFVRQLVDLVNDFLDMSKIEAGHIELDLAEMDAVEMLDSALDNFRIDAEDRGIVLRRLVGASIPRFRGDRRRLQQVLTNLISNASKFTPADGAVALSVSATHGKAHGAERGGQQAQPKTQNLGLRGVQSERHRRGHFPRGDRRAV